jgi:hypothetical protein
MEEHEARRPKEGGRLGLFKNKVGRRALPHGRVLHSPTCTRGHAPIWELGLRGEEGALTAELVSFASPRLGITQLKKILK